MFYSIHIRQTTYTFGELPDELRLFLEVVPPSPALGGVFLFPLLI